MTNLTAKFKLIDEMSDKLDSIADSGKDMMDAWEKSSDTISTAMDKYEQSANSAAASTDYWTEAVGNYDKGALEAIYSTEELVEMGFKSADALEEVEDASEKAGRGLEELSDESDEAGEHLEDTGEKGANAMNNLGKAITSAGVIVLIKKVADTFLEASEAAAEYEVAIQKISTVADTSVVSMSDMSGELYELSQKTGISVGELSEATYSALSASVDSAKAVQFTSTATQLAAGGFTSSATAVDVLTTALNAYGLSADNAENISDMLITTQNLGKTTVDQLAASVGKVIPLASAYGVEMDNLSAAYAELTKGGIATAESGTYLKAMLNELGDSGSIVSAVLKEQTGETFSDLMEKGYSLGDVMAVLGESVNGNAGAFNELWSSSEAGIGALSLYNAGAEQFNRTLTAMQHSAGATTSAYETMTSTTAHAEEELTNATDNLKIAIGENVNPLFEKMYSAGTAVTNWMSKFTKEHPLLTKAISSITIGVAAAAAGMALFTFATTTAIPAIKTFAVAANAALGPVGWVALGITGVVTALAAFTGMAEEARDYNEDLTVSCRKQAEQLDNLKEKYDEACEKYGETSDEAYYLQFQIEELSDEFEAGKETVGEYINRMDELNDSWNENLDKNREAYAEVEKNEERTLALTRKLEQLASQTDITSESEAQMKAIIAELNKEIPNLNLNYEKVIENAGSFRETVETMIKAEAATKKYEAAMQGAADAYNVMFDAQTTLEDQKSREAQLIEEVAQKYEAYNKAQEEHLFWVGSGGRGNYGDTLAANERKAKDAYESSKNELEQLQGKIEETQGTLDTATADYNKYIDTIAKMDEATKNAFESSKSATEVIDAMALAVQDLATEYNQAYEAAKTSFDGQFELFDEAKANMESTVANAQKALDSQLAYWDNYLQNVNVLKEMSASDLGITQENYNALMQYVQDGSAEAAGLAQSMVSAINSGNEEAITKLANTVGEVNTKKAEAAQAVAEWQIDFNGKMEEIVKKAEETVTKMNLSSDAYAAASATIQSYADAILAKGGAAIANAQSIANRVKAALQSGNVSVPTAGGYAEGTDYATPGPHLVGENGPEIVEFRGGEKVYNNDETERIMARTAAVKFFAQSDGGQPVQETGKTETGDNKKTIRLEINGGGTIDVNGSMDEETVVGILQSHLKPVLTSIVKQEIYEEGEQSYDF